MNTFSMIVLWMTGAAFAGLVIAAMVSDVRTMLIGNRVSIALFFIFLPAAWAAGLSLEAALFHLAVGALVLVVGIGLFALRLIGGGDVKFAAAVAVWLGWPATGGFLLLFALLGGVLAVLVALVRKMPSLPGALGRLPWLKKGEGDTPGETEAGIPYGLAIGVAALVVFLRSPIGLTLLGS